MLKWLSRFIPCGRRRGGAGEAGVAEPQITEEGSSPSVFSVGSLESAGSGVSTRAAQHSVLDTPLVGGPAVFVVNWGDSGTRLGCRRVIPTAIDLAHPEFRVYAVWDIPGWGQIFAG